MDCSFVIVPFYNVYLYQKNIIIYYILSSNKGIFVWPIWSEVNCPYFHTRENNRLLDYYKIISISRSILAQANMGLDFVSGQYWCLFSRCRKYVINSLIHGHFHIGLVIIPRPNMGVSGWQPGQYGNAHVLICIYSIIFSSHKWNRYSTCVQIE
jgi:hypothetical protein